MENIRKNESPSPPEELEKSNMLKIQQANYHKKVQKLKKIKANIAKEVPDIATIAHMESESILLQPQKVADKSPTFLSLDNLISEEAYDQYTNVGTETKDPIATARKTVISSFIMPPTERERPMNQTALSFLPAFKNSNVFNNTQFYRNSPRNRTSMGTATNTFGTTQFTDRRGEFTSRINMQIDRSISHMPMTPQTSMRSPSQYFRKRNTRNSMRVAASMDFKPIIQKQQTQQLEIQNENQQKQQQQQKQKSAIFVHNNSHSFSEIKSFKKFKARQSPFSNYDDNYNLTEKQQDELKQFLIDEVYIKQKANDIGDLEMFIERNIFQLNRRQGYIKQMSKSQQMLDETMYNCMQKYIKEKKDKQLLTQKTKGILKGKSKEIQEESDQLSSPQNTPLYKTPQLFSPTQKLSPKKPKEIKRVKSIDRQPLSMQIQQNIQKLKNLRAKQPSVFEKELFKLRSSPINQPDEIRIDTKTTNADELPTKFETKIKIKEQISDSSLTISESEYLSEKPKHCHAIKKMKGESFLQNLKFDKPGNKSSIQQQNQELFKDMYLKMSAIDLDAYEKFSSDRRKAKSQLKYINLDRLKHKYQNQKQKVGSLSNLDRQGTLCFHALQKQSHSFLEAQCPSKLLEMLYENWRLSEGKANQDQLLTENFKKTVNITKNWTYLDLVMAVFADPNDLNSLDAQIYRIEDQINKKFVYKYKSRQELAKIKKDREKAAQRKKRKNSSNSLSCDSSFSSSCDEIEHKIIEKQKRASRSPKLKSQPSQIYSRKDTQSSEAKSPSKNLRTEQYMVHQLHNLIIQKKEQLSKGELKKNVSLRDRVQNVENLDILQLMNLKRLAEQAKKEKTKKQALDIKLQKLEGGFSNTLSAKQLKEMMNDSHVIDRFTEYICNIMFKYSDPWIKKKYNNYKNEQKPLNGIDFFERMQQDLIKRKNTRKQTEKITNAVSQNLINSVTKKQNQI